MRVFFGIMGFIGTVFVSIIYGSPISIFIDVPSFFIVFGTVITLTTIKYKFSEIAEFSDDVVSSTISFSLLGGFIGLVIGLIQMLQNFSMPEALGPALAIALLSSFYSILFASILFVIKKNNQHYKLSMASIVATSLTLIPFILLISSFTKK